MKATGKIVALLVVLGLAVGIVLSLTNPSRQAHVQTIQGKIHEESGVIGNFMFRVVQTLEGKQLQYHNYLVCSTVTLDGDIITLGFLKNVFVADKTQVSRFVQELN